MKYKDQDLMCEYISKYIYIRKNNTPGIIPKTLIICIDTTSTKQHVL